MALSTPHPTGTVTFLFTDIEGSTRRWEAEPDVMRVALAANDEVLRAAIDAREGWLFKHTGDGVCAVFRSAQGAVDAAVDAQRALALPVRMGIATGEAELRNDDYFGPALNRTARIMDAGHGGQVLLDASTIALVRGCELLDLGPRRLRDLSEPLALFQVCAEGLRRDFPPLHTLDAAPGNLPSRATSFVGRDREMAELAGLLSTARLVTLTGVGGVGKTRLALQVAAEVSGAYPDGTWLVELAAVGDPTAAGHAIAAVLGIAPQAGKSIGESIVEALRGRRLLLVLDNCEHLIDAAAALAHEILAHCPQVTLLATSREALMVDGERIQPVPSLDLRAGARSPAVTLFVERARAIVPEFTLSDQVDVVAEICRRLDGIPLAIELAAARIRAMAPAQIRDRLDERFRMLTGGSRRSLERHQTLRHAVQWSFDLLAPGERAVLARASVFAGGFGLEAAEQVCAGETVEASDLLDLLDSLVRKSLVTAERSGAAVRYGLLETIRQFGEEQLAALGEGDATRERHAAFFAADSARQFEIWRSPRERAAYEWLDREMDNLRVAFRWAADRQAVDRAAEIASNIGDMGRMRFRDEAATWAAEIVDAARDVRHRRLVVLLTWAASSAWGRDLLEEAKRYADEAIALVGSDDFDPLVWAYTDRAWVALFQGDLEAAIGLVQAGAAHPADGHDRFCLATVPYTLAMCGRHHEARRIADDVIATVEAAGFPTAIVSAHSGKGAAYAESDAATALAAFERGLAVAQQCGNRVYESLAMAEVAALRARIGDPVNALRSFRQMLQAARGTTDAIFARHGLGNLILLFERLGRQEAAATLYGMLTRVFRSHASIPDVPDAVARVRGAIGDPTFQALAKRGSEMTADAATDHALQEIRQALATLGQPDG